MEENFENHKLKRRLLILDLHDGEIIALSARSWKFLDSVDDDFTLWHPTNVQFNMFGEWKIMIFPIIVTIVVMSDEKNLSWCFKSTIELKKICQQPMKIFLVFFFLSNFHIPTNFLCPFDSSKSYFFSHQTLEEQKKQQEKKKNSSLPQIYKKISRENLILTLSNKFHVGGWQGFAAATADVA